MGTQASDLADGDPVALPVVTWAAGIAASALGAGALIGWASGSRALTRFVPGMASMRPTTAICLILLGTAVITLVWRPLWSWAGPAATIGAGVIAGVSLLESVLDRDLLIDRWLFRQAVDQERYGGRMALSTAIELIVLTVALLAAYRRYRRVAQGFALLAFTGAAVASLGYIYGERHLYASSPEMGMAFNTALALVLVSIGLLAAIPNGAFPHLFRRPAPGAVLSRRLLPWITVVMPIIGWLRLEGERHGLFGPPLGTAIMVLAGGLLVTAIARLAAVSMDRQAAALNHAWHQYGLVSAGQDAGRS